MKKTPTQNPSQTESCEHKSAPAVPRPKENIQAPPFIHNASLTNKGVKRDHSDSLSISQSSEFEQTKRTKYSMHHHDPSLSQRIQSAETTDHESEATTSIGLAFIPIRDISNSTNTMNRESTTTTSTLTPFSSHDGVGTSLFQEIQDNVTRCLSERSSSLRSPSVVTVPSSGLETLPSIRTYLDHLDDCYDPEHEDYGQFCDCSVQSESEYESDDDEVSRINTGQCFRK